MRYSTVVLKSPLMESSFRASTMFLDTGEDKTSFREIARKKSVRIHVK